MADSIIESPLVTTIKASDDRDSPWVVIRSKDSQQLQAQLQELENGSVFADIGRVAALFQVQARLGAQLGAKGIDPQQATGSFEGVTAAPAATDSAPAAQPPAATTQPAVAPTKFPSFGAFKAPATAATPPTAPATSATRPAAEPPTAAPAASGFPAAPAWKKS